MRTIRTVMVLGGVLLCRTGSGGAWAAGDRPLLVDNGQARADIVVAAQPPRTTRLAAEELQAYVEKISGARLEMVTAPGTNAPLHIYVGRSAHTDRMGITDDGLEHGAFRMVSVPDGLVLLGRDRDFTPPEPRQRYFHDRERVFKEWDALTGETWEFPLPLLWKEYNAELGIWELDERGTLNAVHEFLRGLGVRWYWPGENGEIVPRQSMLALPEMDRWVVPDFPMRYFYFYRKFAGASRETVLWRLRQGLNRNHQAMGLAELGHGTIYVHGRDEIKQAHPEYYALWGSERKSKEGPYGKPCLSSEGLFQANLRFVRTMFDHYDAPMVSVMPADGYTILCRCELCEEKGTYERGYEGQLSDYVWDYVNRLGSELHRTHPDRKILCYAYGAFLLPPERIAKLSPNIAVGICYWRSWFHDPDRRRHYEEIRRGWLEKLPSGRLEGGIWDYYLHAREGGVFDGVPAVYPQLIAEDLRSLKGVSPGDGIEVFDLRPNRSDGSVPDLAVNHLNLYVTARLYWDADRDVDALLTEYYELFYGPAQREMRTFFEFAEEHWPRMRTSAPLIEKTFELLEDARRAAPQDSVYAQRIALIHDYMQPLHALHEKLTQGRERVNVPQAVARRSETDDVVLDGRLDEAFWQGAAVYKFKDLVTSGEAVVQTQFRMVSVGEALYFGIHCAEPDMANLKVTARKGGDRQDQEDIWWGDVVEVLFETQSHSYYQIAVNPDGALVDADRLDNLVNLQWSSGAEAAVHRGEDFWSVELLIPIAGAMARDADPLRGVQGVRPVRDPWYFNVCRQRVRGAEREWTAFSPTGTNTFHEVMKFGELLIR